MTNDAVNTPTPVTLMGTGPRDWRASWYPEFRTGLSAFVESYQQVNECTVSVLSGGAQGFDIALAKCASELGIPFSFLLPNPTYVDYYYRGKGHQPHYLGRVDTMLGLMKQATNVEYVAKTLYVLQGNRNVHSNFVRNDALVQRSDLCVAGFDSTGAVPLSGGTGHAVQAALAGGLDVYNQAFVLALRPAPVQSSEVPF